MPFFTGLVGGLSEGIAGARKEAADRNERSAQLEASILQHLSTSTDPEISSRALAGLLGHADPSTRKRAKGLRGFLGETEGNPALPMLRDFISAGRPGPDIPAAGAAGVPELAVQSGLPASASAPVARPGSLAQPATPGIHPGLSGPPPGPQAAAVRPGATMAGPPVPRQVFRTPDEQAALTHGATTTAEIDAKLRARRGMTTPEAVSIFGHPESTVTNPAGTAQGKMLPPGTVDNAGRPVDPDAYYTGRASRTDPSQVDYFPVNAPASIANQQAIASRPTFQHMVGPDGKSPGVWRVARDGSRPNEFVGYSGAKASYLQYIDPVDQTVTYVSAPAQFTPMAELPSSATPPQGAGAAGAPTAATAAAPAARPLAGPPPSPTGLPGASGASGAPRPVGSGQTPAAAAAGGPRGISGGRKRDLASVEGAFMGPDGPVAGTAFLDKGLGQYFSSQDSTQPATGFIPGDLGAYAVGAFHLANSTLITIERAIQALDDGGFADPKTNPKANDPAQTAALMAKFYGGQSNPVEEAAMSMTNLAALQGASQYVKSNSRSYQMFQSALMHLPRTPNERAAQLSQTKIGGAITPVTAGILPQSWLGGHGWDSPAVMRQKLELAKSVIQQGKVSLSELVGKAPEKAVGAGGPPAPGGRGAAPTGRGAAPTGSFSVTAPDGSVHPFDTQAQADAFKALIASATAQAGGGKGGGAGRGRGGQ